MSGAVALLLWLTLKASLPQMDGSVAISNVALSGDATLQRDAWGVAEINAKSRQDVAFVTGYVHAQERFFQMDLLRRRGAGELAELIGTRALEIDRANRPFDFRRRSVIALDGLPPAQAELLRHYANGVNEGLNQLRAWPFEYLFLRSAPLAWLPEDSLLVIWSMYFELQGQMYSRELALDWLHIRSSTRDLASLLPLSSPFDIAVDGTPSEEAASPQFGDRPLWLTGNWKKEPASHHVNPTPLVGSNAWAVSAARGGEQRALLQNDMHLALRLPNTWFRLSVSYPGADAIVRVDGVSLPGVPVIIAGSNGQIAWGFTNAYARSLKLVPLETTAGDPLHVRTPRGWESVGVRRESLLVRGEATEVLAVLESSLGPIRQAGGRTFAIQWVAQTPGAVDISMLDLEVTRNAESALEVAKRSGIPAQNFVVADRNGNIGWTIAGALADPNSKAPNVRLSPSRYPTVLNPARGQIVSANNGHPSGSKERLILGDGGADMGARATHIAMSLTALSRISEEEMRRIALDDRSFYLNRWKSRLDHLLDDQSLVGNTRRSEFKMLLQTWTGRADPDQAAYRLVRAFMHTLYAEVFATLDGKLVQLDPASSYAAANPRWPLVLERLCDQQPAGWWPAGQTWRDAQLRALDTAMSTVAGDVAPLAEATWGRRNVASIRHPLADLLPSQLGDLLSAPSDSLPGDDHMPRVSAPGFGQSMRMVVSPGHEESATLDMPGGQSGHPLSPFFLSTHSAWQRDEALPLRPGPAVHSLQLKVR